MIDELMRKRKIPWVKLGYKTVRFYWPTVEAALNTTANNARINVFIRAQIESKPVRTIKDFHLELKLSPLTCL